MSKKLQVAVLFGGKSAEHEVSLQSARSIVNALDKNKYEVTLIGIGKDGKWYLNDTSKALLESKNPKLLKLNSASENVTLVPGSGGNQLVTIGGSQPARSVDVVFPVLHGTYGEDGTVQGLLKLAGVPFVGPSVLGSAIGMDKDVVKRLLKEAGIPVARGFAFKRSEIKKISFDSIVSQIGLPVFVKPANAGSSVGVSKVTSAAEFASAVAKAFRYDSKIIVEEGIDGRELECSVLGNEDPIASVPGEVIPQHEFYSYEAKYIDQNGANLKIPASLPAETVKRIQELAVKTFQVLCCEGMARVDMFLTKDDRLLINEINTIPGFTNISMYPKLWEATGMPFPELLDRLIQLAIERFEREQNLETSFDTQVVEAKPTPSEVTK
jgi:D-alanine-D-alanine ligase